MTIIFIPNFSHIDVKHLFRGQKYQKGVTAKTAVNFFYCALSFLYFLHMFFCAALHHINSSLFRMLSEKQKKAIKNEYATTGNCNTVAEKTGHYSIHTVLAVLKNKTRKVRSQPATPRLIDKHLSRRIRRHVNAEIAKGHVVVASKIKADLKLTCSERIIQRLLPKKGFVNVLTRQELRLSVEHKKARVNFAERCIAHHEDVKNWIFTDEKKFNGDGPDFLGTYTFTNDQISKREKRQGGVVSVMAFGAIEPNGKLLITVSLGWQKHQSLLF